MRPCSSICSSRRKTPKFSCIVAAELVADPPRPLALAAVEQLAQLGVGVAHRALGHGDGRVRRARHSAASAPARRPKVIVSISALPPRRFAPCTEMHATSPAA